MPTTEDIFSQAGVPASIWKPIQAIESGGNPLTHTVTSNEDSVGLFQLNRQGGLGAGYSVAQLQDPALNAQIAAKAMAPAYQAGVQKSLSGLDLLRYVAYNSGWPTTQGVGALSYDKTVQTYDTKLESSYTAQTTPAASTASTTATTSTSVGLPSQLSTLQKTAQGGDWGLLIVIAGLGLLLIYFGLKTLGGGETIAIMKEGE